MNFLLLCIQSVVCVACVILAKKLGVISFREFDLSDAKAWFPISFLLVSVIYTGSKSLVSQSYNVLHHSSLMYYSNI
jgi:GDP-mannose transporter